MSDMFAEIMQLLHTYVTAGGALWAAWGMIVLAGGLKDKSGPQLQSGIWQIIGGALIIAAAALFDQVALG